MFKGSYILHIWVLFILPQFRGNSMSTSKVTLEGSRSVLVVIFESGKTVRGPLLEGPECPKTPQNRILAKSRDVSNVPLR